MAKLISQAMEQAGIRPSPRSRKVGDYLLDQLIDEGPGYQDWKATHVRLPDVKRRVRLYLVRSGASAEDRATIERAALREFPLLESLQHPGILRVLGFTEHPLGPALIFEHDPHAIRLDHYLIQRKENLSVDQRLDLVRQIAEIVRFAHDKRVVHRGLCPQSILVTGPDRRRPRVQILNWHLGYREAGSSNGAVAAVTATSHVDCLVEDARTVYMAPEALSETGGLGEHLDVFSLGALAYHLFSGVPPASSRLELNNLLRQDRGLRIGAVLNGAGQQLQDLIQFSTFPDVSSRIDSAVDFLELLEKVEDELTAPEHDVVVDPALARKDDPLPGGYRVVKRLGQGACSIVLLVEKEGQHYVLKAASDPKFNARLKDETEVLQKLRHPHIVEFCGAVEIGDRAGFLMRPVFAEKDAMRIETLGQRIRREGRLHVDLLQRFGADLLDVLNYLEELGYPHRDIKPDNIAVGMIGRGDTLHLVLFDFSLSRTPTEKIGAGTAAYNDPFLAERAPTPRWDLQAERFAAAVTLHELATGTLPHWGDGTSHPAQLDCEATIDAELFDSSLRESLTSFFRQALRRDPSRRFDNAEEMLRAWRHAFEGIEPADVVRDAEDEAQRQARLASATPATTIAELGLGTRATNALDRANVLTVADLLAAPMRRLLRLRGVGNKTRREIATAVRILRAGFARPPPVKAP